MHFISQQRLFFLSIALQVSFSEQKPPAGDFHDFDPPLPPDSPSPPYVNPGDPDFIKDLHQIFPTVTCYTYSMSYADENYATPEINGGGYSINWGMHALQWKGYNHIADNPGTGTFDAELANASSPPRINSSEGGPNPIPDRHVSCYGAERLNELELASSGIFETNENPTDPTGSWPCLEEPDPYAAAIQGAMNMFYWNTPTYVDSLNIEGNLDDLIPSSLVCSDPLVAEECFDAVVMKKVTLCAEGPDPPHVACNWDDDDATGEVGSCESTLVLESIIAGFFAGTSYIESDTIFGPDNIQDWATYYELSQFYSNNYPNELVFDPPAGTDVASLQDRARLTAKKFLKPLELASMIANKNSEGGVRGSAPGGKK